MPGKYDRGGECIVATVHGSVECVAFRIGHWVRIVATGETGGIERAARHRSAYA